MNFNLISNLFAKSSKKKVYIRTYIKLFIKRAQSSLNCLSLSPILHIDLSKFVHLCEKQGLPRALHFNAAFVGYSASYYEAHHSMSDIQLHTPTLPTRG